MKPQPTWYLYLVECRDGSLYAGITVDVARRYAQHVAGTGARYTRSHPPLRLLGHCAYANRAEASRAEYQIKRLAPAHKRALCDAWNQIPPVSTHDTTGKPDGSPALKRHGRVPVRA